MRTPKLTNLCYFFIGNSNLSCFSFHFVFAKSGSATYSLQVNLILEAYGIMNLGIDRNTSVISKDPLDGI